MNNIKLICFDLDETIITHSSWKILHEALGVSKEEDRKMWIEYRDGQVSYDEWNTKVLNHYLKHQDATREGITDILSRYTYANGAREAIQYLKDKGYILVLISGSIDILVDIVMRDLGMHFAKANNTFVFNENNRLQAIHSDGDDTKAKVIHLENFCKTLNIDMHQCACVGDGANDLGLFKKTGHGITFKGSNVEKDAWKVIGTLHDLKDIFA